MRYSNIDAKHSPLPQKCYYLSLTFTEVTRRNVFTFMNKNFIHCDWSVLTAGHMNIPFILFRQMNNDLFTVTGQCITAAHMNIPLDNNFNFLTHSYMTSKSIFLHTLQIFHQHYTVPPSWCYLPQWQCQQYWSLLC